MQLFVNDLTVIDFSYLCKDRGVVGESWIVDVLLDGALNEQSMVLDFGIVKKQIKAIIDDAVDHKLLLPMLDDNLTVTDSSYQADHEFVDFESAVGSFYLQSPAQAFAKINHHSITIDAVNQHLNHIILEQLPKNVKGLSLTLRAEVIDSDYYHYTHGLKLHDGNCQRIAHGHRSKIQIFRNNERCTTLEELWCQRWQDIYIASEADRIEKSALELSENAMAKLKPDHHFFSYFAPQGRFDIAVPERKLDVVDCDSTVELLADFILRQLSKGESDKDDRSLNLKVVAYEGVAKGAIVSNVEK